MSELTDSLKYRIRNTLEAEKRLAEIEEERERLRTREEEALSARHNCLLLLNEARLNAGLPASCLVHLEGRYFHLKNHGDGKTYAHEVILHGAPIESSCQRRAAGVE